MAVITISGDATLVSGRTEIKNAGEAIAQWDAVYYDSTDGSNAKKAIGTSAAAAAVKGIALNAATDDGAVVVALDGAVINSDAADFTAGLVAYLDDGAAGAVTATEADIASSNYKTLVFFPESTTQITVTIAGPVQKA